MLEARALGYETLLLNCNPETVSTDYDLCDRQIFDEISLESVLAVCDAERPDAVIVSMGGQAANSLALDLVGHAQAAAEGGMNAHALQHLVDLRAAAVDHHDSDPDVAEQANVAREALFQGLVDHGVPAIFHDESALMEAPDVGQRFV